MLSTAVVLTSLLFLSYRYLNISTLHIGRATRSGVYRCSAVNKYRIVSHSQLHFVVMDAEEMFAVTSSTDEPTINDTIIVTCKASLVEYESIRWIPNSGNLSEFAYTLLSIFL